MADIQVEDVHDVSDDPKDLEQQIERTRDDLAVTIDAIADRVSPKRVASRGVATAKEAASNAAQNAKDAARSAMIMAQQKVADLRHHGSSPEVVDQQAVPGATTFQVERRPTNTPAIVAGVAAGVVLVAVLLRRRSR